MRELRARLVGVAGLLASLAIVSPTGGAAASASASADALIREAVRARLGESNAEVTILSLDLPARAGTAFRAIRVDPAAWLGKPMRFTLTPVTGAPVVVVASLRVVADHVVALRDIARSAKVGHEDALARRDEVTGVPMRRLPQAAQVLGGRALRPVPAGAILLPGAVTVRRMVEAGDPVTVVARVGEAEVTASLVASDGGEPGDVIRVTNPETRRDLRGRVMSDGRVEVLHAR